MIAGAIRFPNRNGDSAGEAGKQQRALDLRTCDGTRVREPAELAAANREREPVTAFRDVRPHLLERLRDPPHRPATQRGIAGESGGELLAGENPEHEAGGGSRISAMQPGCPAPETGCGDRNNPPLDSQ